MTERRPDANAGDDTCSEHRGADIHAPRHLQDEERHREWSAYDRNAERRHSGERRDHWIKRDVKNRELQGNRKQLSNQTAHKQRCEEKSAAKARRKRNQARKQFHGNDHRDQARCHVTMQIQHHRTVTCCQDLRRHDRHRADTEAPQRGSDPHRNPSLIEDPLNQGRASHDGDADHADNQGKYDQGKVMFGGNRPDMGHIERVRCTAEPLRRKRPGDRGRKDRRGAAH